MLPALLVASLAGGLGPASAHAAFPGANGRIAFTRDTFEDDMQIRIWSVNPDGTGETLLADSASHGAWSADGKQIAYDGISVMNADGTGKAPVPGAQAGDYLPAWSPDGLKLAFVRGENIYVMNADGSDQTPLTDDEGSDAEPAWSPDGQHIAFISNRDGNYDVYVMNADGSNEVALTSVGDNNVDPSWSPDGQRLAFGSDRDANEQNVYVMFANGADQHSLTDATAADFDPAWSPDGQKIVFNRGGDLWIMSAADGSALTFVTSSSATQADWQPLPPDSPVVDPSVSGPTTTTATPGDKDNDGIPDDLDTNDGSLAPVPGKSVNLRVVSGDVYIKVGGASSRASTTIQPGPQKGFVPLKGAATIPIGVEVDVEEGRVDVRSAANLKGTTRSAQFYAGVFQIKQKRAAKAMSTDVLVRTSRGRFGKVCGTTARAATAKGTGAAAIAKKKQKEKKRSKKVVTQLWGDGTGNFKTVGKSSAAAVRGTIWLTQERCDGTLTRVKRGRVAVRDFGRKRNVLVTAGHSYLARATRAQLVNP